MAAATLSACSHSTDQAAADVPSVEVGDCFVDGAPKPVSCDDNHVAQTVYVSRTAPSDMAAALEPCREAQARFLGQDFNTRLDVHLWVPQDLTWYRCDVVLRN